MKAADAVGCLAMVASLACGTEPTYEACAPLRDDIETPWDEPTGEPDGPRFEQATVTWTGNWNDGCEADFELGIRFRGNVTISNLEEMTVFAQEFDEVQPTAEPLGPVDTGGGASGGMFRKMCMRNMTSHLTQSILLFFRDAEGRGSNVFCASMAGDPPSGGTP